LSYLQAKQVVANEKRVHFANPAVIEDSDTDDQQEPRAVVISDKKMSNGTHSTCKDASMKRPHVSPPVSETNMPTKSPVTIPYENHEVEQRMVVGAGTSLENGTISGKERRLLIQKRAETKGHCRLAGTTMDINDAHRLFGHKLGATLQKIATALGVKLTGKFKPCTSCVLRTARLQAHSPLLCLGDSMLWWLLMRLQGYPILYN
jgi:hypothetical protein